MGRPNIHENPLFIEGKARFEPIKSIVEDAKREADLLVKMARRKVEDETLALVASLKKRGLSNYGIGLITGVTRNDLLKDLIARAEAYAGDTLAPLADGIVDVGGWLFGPAGAAGVTEAGHHTSFVAPDGTRYTVAYGEDNKCHWYFADGTRLTYDQCDALLTFEVEEFARANAL
jgi:hypothetical protein